MTDKVYNDKEWLYNQYVVLGKTGREIAKICGVHNKTIFRYLWKCDIPTRTIAGNKHTEKHRKRIADSHKEKCATEAQKRRQSIIKLKYYLTHDAPMKGREFSDEHKRKLSLAQKRRFVLFDNPMKGRKMSEDSRKRMSAVRQGISVGEWESFVSFAPYCSAFNNELKEKIRNRDNRVCQLCGKSEILDGRRLSVHHIDGDKMQGCNGKKFHLVALCNSCNTKPDTIEKEFLLVTNMR